MRAGQPRAHQSQLQCRSGGVSSSEAGQALPIVAVVVLLVLLIGTWFDGVLFRIPLAVPFWVLLLAGTGDLSEVMACPRLTGEPSQQAKD